MRPLQALVLLALLLGASLPTQAMTVSGCYDWFDDESPTPGRTVCVRYGNDALMASVDPQDPIDPWSCQPMQVHSEDVWVLETRYQLYRVIGDSALGTVRWMSAPHPKSGVIQGSSVEVRYAPNKTPGLFAKAMEICAKEAQRASK